MTSVSQVEPLQPLTAESRPLTGGRDWSQTLLSRAWSGLKWIMQRATAQQVRKNLRICETLSFGEKRFVAVVQVDEERFLIGGSSSSVSLLTRLPEAKTFAPDLKREAEKIL
jgi:flagellar biogenesis protein FliO